MSATPNPYDPPQTNAASDDIDQQPSRESLAELIRSFLASDITAFEFDERLDAYRDCDDPVVSHVAFAVWYHYDDCVDHFVCLSKPEWDYFQRLLLVLAAPCRVETQSHWQWSHKQLLAACLLGAFAFFAIEWGWGQQLLVLSIPFGVASIALSFWHHRRATPPEPYTDVVFPFATFSDLATAYRQSGFRKTQYPKQLNDRRIRARLTAAFLQGYNYVLWLIFSPIPLLVQALPEHQTTTRIKV
jgi:hypothetical protein